MIFRQVYSVQYYSSIYIQKALYKVLCDFKKSKTKRMHLPLHVKYSKQSITNQKDAMLYIEEYEK